MLYRARAGSRRTASSPAIARRSPSGVFTGTRREAARHWPKRAALALRRPALRVRRHLQQRPRAWRVPGGLRRHREDGRAERRRRLSLIRSERPLLLLDIDNPKTHRVFGLDARISTSKQYGTTRAWGRAWHDWYQRLDGIRFLARKESRTFNYCLFLDRCAHDLRTTHFGSLGRTDRRRILGRIDGYRITLEL